MKQKTLLFLSMAVVASMFTGCSESNGSEPVATVASDKQPTDEDSTAAPEEDNKADANFEVHKIEEGEKYQFDVDGDGQDDTLYVEEKDFGKPGEYDKYHYSLHVGDSKVGIITEETSDYDSANVYYVHRDDGSYVFATLYGASCWTTEFYKWDNGEFTHVEEANDFMIEDESVIKADKITLHTYVNAFGTHEGIKEYAYGADGLEPESDGYIIPDASGLKLKRDVTFKDESGNECGTAKAGESIVPVSVNDNVVGFEDEKGKFLGYLTKENGAVDGVSEDDLFESIMYGG